MPPPPGYIFQVGDIVKTCWEAGCEYEVCNKQAPTCHQEYRIEAVIESKDVMGNYLIITEPPLIENMEKHQFSCNWFYLVRSKVSFNLNRFNNLEIE